MSTAPAAPYTKRIRLAALLCEAAELEHGLMCQYLYAWFTFKREPEEGVSWEQLESMRRWGASLLLVARQEMEHLGLVCNLLTAIGEAPYLSRPNFPLAARHYPMDIPSLLAPFELDAIKRFILFEMPDEITPDEQAFIHRLMERFDHHRYTTIGRLYEEISGLFSELDGPDLFIGPPSAQLGNPQILPVPIRGIQLPPSAAIYDVLLSPVYDLPSAQKVITQIIVEGEGAPTSHPAGAPTSHFARFVAMYTELSAARQADPSFVPARPVVHDPRSATIELDSTRVLVDLFDEAYQVMMLLLFRFFGQSDETAAEIAALQHAAFFPMMTAVVRPLGEIVTQLPVRAGAKETAGPRFDFDRPVSLLPHRESAWHTIHSHLALLASEAGAAAVDPAYPPEIGKRLTLIFENASRIAVDFAAATGVTS